MVKAEVPTIGSNLLVGIYSYQAARREIPENIIHTHCYEDVRTSQANDLFCVNR